YVAERILWIRSAGFIGTGDAEPAGRALVWLFSPLNWGNVFKALADDFRRYPVRIVAALVVLALMIFLQPLARSRIRKTSEVVSKNKSASYWHTVQCFVAAVLVVLPGPTALWIVAWRLTRAADVGEFGMALATALHLSALLLLGLRF